MAKVGNWRRRERWRKRMKRRERWRKRMKRRMSAGEELEIRKREKERGYGR